MKWTRDNFIIWLAYQLEGGLVYFFISIFFLVSGTFLTVFAFFCIFCILTLEMICVFLHKLSLYKKVNDAHESGDVDRVP